jgi:hemolysin
MKKQQTSVVHRQRKNTHLPYLLIASLLAPAYPLTALAAGIAAASGSGTGVVTQNGVPVVSIATTSASGLSHNRYTDFNVGREGAVFNNSLVAGASQLAGQLSANGNLQGRQANVILNEVVTANSSQLLGKQEIFGQRADLVLANPNGITCNGCGFINVNQATLAVARPTVEGGVLKSLTGSQTDALLQTDGTINAEGTDVLRLISPSAKLGGNVKGGQAVSILLGKNTVDAASGQVIASETLSNTDRRYDSTLFGAMQAGRIQILSTSAGVGVNLNAATLQATNIDVTADQIAIRGKVTQSTVKDSHSHTNWWNWGRAGREYLDIDETDTRQTMTRSQLNASGNLTLTANATLNVGAADLNGQSVDLSGNTVALETESTTDTYRYFYRDAINLWSYQKTENRDSTTQHGARVTAGQQLSLDAMQNANLIGAQLSSAGDARVTAGNDLVLMAAVNTSAGAVVVKEVNKTIINNSASNTSYNNQSLVVSSVTASGDLALDAAHDVNLNAAKLQSGGDSLLSAGGVVVVDAQSFTTAQSASALFSNTGGLFGGYDSSSGAANTLYQGSDLQAGGTTYLVADGDVRVRGSRVKAAEGVYAVSRTGGIGIDVAKGASLTSSSGSTQTVFNITTDASSTQTTQQVIKGSDLLSEANLTLISAEDTEVIGSLLQAAGDIGITAAGGLAIRAATADATTLFTSSTTQGYAEGGADAEAQYSGRVGIETVTTSGAVQTTDVTGAALQSGGDVSLSADATVAINGSTVQAGGDISLSGTDIDVTAAQSTQTAQVTTDTVGGGFYADAGVDTIGVGIEINTSTSTTASTSSTAEVSSLTAGGDITREATGSVTDEGTQIVADGAVITVATDVNSLAATNTSSSTTETTSVHVELGVAADTGFGRPVYDAIVKTVEDAQVGVVTMPIPEGAVAPSVSGGLAVTGGNTTTTTSSSSATVSSVAAGSITTVATDTLTLQGSQLSTDGAVALNAGTVLVDVAENTQQTQTDSTQGSGSLGATLETSGTLTPSIAVAVTTSQSSSVASTQQGASINGSAVTVAAAGDATLIGTQLQSEGDLTLSSGGDLLIAAATDSQSSTSSSQGGSGSVGVTMLVAPAPTVTGVSASGSYQQSESSSSATQAVTASLSSGGDLQISSGDDLVVTGDLSAGGDASLSADGDLVLAANRDTSLTSSDSVLVSANVNLGLSGGSVTGGSGSAGLQTTSTEQRTDSLEGSTVNVGGELSLSSGGDTLLSGTDVQAGAVVVNVEGDLTLQSVQSTNQESGSSFSGSLGIAAANGIAMGSGSGDLQVAVGSDTVNQVTQENADVDAGTIQIQTGDDLTLAGATVMASDSLMAAVGGDLAITSLQDVDQSASSDTRVDLHIAVSEPKPETPIESPILDQMGSTMTTVVNTAKTVVENALPYIGAGIEVQKDATSSTSALVTETSGMSAAVVDVQVEGDTTLTGGQISGDQINLETSGLSGSSVGNVINTESTHTNLPLQIDIGAIIGVVSDMIDGQMPVEESSSHSTTL